MSKEMIEAMVVILCICVVWLKSDIAILKEEIKDLKDFTDFEEEEY